MHDQKSVVDADAAVCVRGLLLLLLPQEVPLFCSHDDDDGDDDKKTPLITRRRLMDATKRTDLAQHNTRVSLAMNGHWLSVPF